MTFISKIKKQIKKYKNHKIIKSELWYTAGKFVQQRIAFITVLIFTRLLISAYGTFTLFRTWRTIFTIVITLNLFSSVKRAHYDFSKKSTISFSLPF